MSLNIYQSKYGTSIDQTSHIQSKILAPWFDDGHFTKIVNSPFPTDTHYEEDLAQSDPLEGDELQLYEKRYHGAFNQSIGKLLHIQQWTRLDINYAVTRLASFTRNPNKPAFLALEHLMQYLHSHLHEPIFYPSTFQQDLQKITYQFSPKQSATYELSSYPVFFSDSSFANILPNRRSMQSNCGLFNGVVTSWGTNIQTSIASNSTDAEIRSIYTTTKKIVAFTHFLTSSAIQDICLQPITLYGDNTSSINIVRQNKISSRSRHLDIPVTYSYENLERQYFTLKHIDRKLNAADISTKSTSGPIVSRHWNFLRGLRFYPPAKTDHGRYLTTSNEALAHVQTNKR